MEQWPPTECAEAARREELVERVTFMLTVGDECGELMHEAFRAPRDQVASGLKADGSVVTDADKAIQRHANQRCLERGEVTVGEEFSTGTYGQDAWHTDPLDGTRDFDERRGNRETAITGFSAGWVATGEDGQVARAGVIKLPLLRRPASLVAIESGCAFSIQGEDIRELRIDPEPATGVVLITDSKNEPRDIAQILTTAGFTPVRAKAAVFKACMMADPTLASEFVEEYADTLSAAEQAALRSVVAGEQTIVGCISNRTQAHDHAAASRIIAEAGGLVCAPDGGPLSFEPGPQGSVFANNADVQQELVRALQESRAPQPETIRG